MMRVAVVVVTCTGLVWGVGVKAAVIKLTAGVDSALDYSDNVTRTVAASAQSDVAYQVSPRIGVTATGKHLRLNADYQLQSVKHSNVGNSELFHQLSLGANIKAFDNQLDMDIRITHSQQTIDEQGTVSDSVTTVTDNTTNVGTTSLAPSMQFRLLDRANLTVTPKLESVAFQSGANSGGVNTGLRVDLSSIPQSGLFRWGLVSNVDKDGASGAVFRSLDATVGVSVGPKLSLSFSTGIEDNSFSTSSNANGGDVWNANANWIISRRTSLSASVGKRFFSTTYGLDFQHSMRNANFTLSFDQSLTTTTQLQLGEPVFDDSGTVLIGFGVPVESTDVFVVENWNSNYNYQISRTSLDLTLTRQTRSAQLAATNDVLTSLTAGVSSRLLGNQWSLNASTSANQFSNTGVRDEFNSLGLTVSRQLPWQASITGTVRRTWRRSNNAAAEFTENIVQLALGVTF